MYCIISVFFVLFYAVSGVAIIPLTALNQDGSALDPKLTSSTPIMTETSPCTDATATVTNLYDIRRDISGSVVEILLSGITAKPDTSDYVRIEVGCGNGVQTNSIILEHDLPTSSIEPLAQMTNVARYAEKKNLPPRGRIQIITYFFFY